MNKKFFVALLIGVSILSFSGCGSSSQEPVSIDSHEEISKTGVLKLQTGVFTNLPGTHFLEDSSGSTTPLASLMINLSDSQYLNNEVNVSGQLKELSSGEQYLEVDKIEVVKELSGSGSWQMYSNSDWGFKIAYKDDWVVDDTSSKITFTAPEDQMEAIVTITRSTHDSKTNLKDVLIEEFGETQVNAMTSSKIGVNQVDALKSKESTGRITYYLKRVDELFTIDFMSGSASDLDSKNTFSEMLLDFQFIGSIDASDTDSSNDNINSSDTDSDLPENSENEVAILNVIKNSPSNFDSSLAGAEVYRIDLVKDSYVYVEFSKSDERMRYLYKYEYSNGAIRNIEVLAKYVPGELTDWKLSDGSNPVLGEETSVHIIKAGGEISSSVLKAGFRYFESERFGFRLQYPSSWYYSGTSGGQDGVVYRYLFSDKPVDDTNVLMTISITAKDTNANLGSSVVTVGDYKIFVSSDSKYAGDVLASIESL